MLGELESNGRIVVCDMEAGVGTMLRLQPGRVDVALIVSEPTVKSIEVARRAARIAASRARVIVVANRVRDERDLEAIRAALGEHEMIVVPEDSVIARADEDGTAPIDANGSSPGVRALEELAERLVSAAG